ncbi:MAG: L-threonylcarbamoyladenylate synthase [Planctomycetes bacterium]|jgi:L-threonylcarbamoyladenylate synthase|nr:L-threonylcarbamoyladenylate synthase [Planctomycetota bacterium]
MTARPARVLLADPADPAAFAAAIAAAAEILRRGGLVAFPTETVYGLGAHALDPEAVARIYAAKGRPSFNPLIVHLADADQLSRLARTVSPLAQRLAAAFWPGPLTLVLPRQPVVPDAVTAGLDTVGVRVPAHPVARALIAAAGLPIAAPSANAYTRVSPTTAAHVLAQLGDRVELVLDGGPAAVGIESTVVDVSGERPVLLRPGGIAAERIEALVGPLLRAAAVAGDAPRPAPGMVDRHYAPRARLQPFAAGERPAVWQQLAELAAAGRRVGLLAFATEGARATEIRCMPGDAAGYARELYAALHALDSAGCELAYVEQLPVERAWEAVADRLRRAGLPGS